MRRITLAIRDLPNAMMTSPRPSIIASLIAVLPLACFVPPALPQDTESTTTDGTDTMTPSGTTGMDPSTTGMDPSVTSSDPDTGSTASVLDGSSSDDGTTTDPGGSGSGSESSSGDSPTGECGDGVLDPSEGCDDNNSADGDLCSSTCQPETVTFAYTGAAQSLTLPPWVDAVYIEAWGAQGGGANCCDPPPQDDGGLGGYAAGTVDVPMGATLQIYVGGQGMPEGPGGFGGGGAGGVWGAGGGGASDVRVNGATLDDRVLTAGGGGGGNCGCPDHGAGGAGGGLDGEAGTSYQGWQPGGGGSQNAGGSAGEQATQGVLGQGGSSATGGLFHFAGGGGGHYGGGGAYAAGGGGGSSYVGMSTDGVTISAVRSGDGEVRITPIQNP